MKDITPSYLDGLQITVQRYIPTFAEACEEELVSPQPFKTPTWTRTFVAFNDQNHFKITDGSEFLEYLKKENLEDGFLPITREQYQHLYSREFECTPSRTMGKSLAYQKEGTLQEGIEDPVLNVLILTPDLRRRVLEEKRKGLEKHFDKDRGGIPLVWIKKEAKQIPFYMCPLLVGPKEYYFAIGEGRFLAMHHYDREEYHFLR